MLIPGGFSAWWKKYSAAALAAIVALQSAWAASEDVRELLPKETLGYITLALAVAGFVGRFIAQTNELTGAGEPPSGLAEPPKAAERLGAGGPAGISSWSAGPDAGTAAAPGGGVREPARTHPTAAFADKNPSNSVTSSRKA